MNAVNLLPPDLRRGSGAPSRSGAAVYIVLGVLGAAVVLAAVTAILQNRVSDREASLARAETEAAAAEQQASSIAHYKQLAAQTSTRVNGVRNVAAGRVQWGKALTQVSQTVGTKVSFTNLAASAAPGVGTGGGNALRSSVASPALEIEGCAENHPAVARLMTRFRGMDDVKRVSLASSSKGGSASTASSDSAGSGGGGGCTEKLPASFSIVIFFDQGQKPVASSTTASGSTAAATSTDGGTK